MDLVGWLAQCPVVAILRGVRPEEAEAIGEAMVAAGVRVLEVPLNSPEPMTSIGLLAKRFAGRALVGGGTFRRVADVEAAADAGAALLVTPHADPALVRAAKARGMLALPGFMTPAEAFLLLDAGADGLKLFPAEAGGPPVLSALRAVLPPQTHILPVGGVDAASLPAWHEAGAAGYGCGSSIYKPGDTAEVAGRRAAALVAAAASCNR